MMMDDDDDDDDDSVEKLFVLVSVEEGGRVRRFCVEGVTGVC